MTNATTAVSTKVDSAIGQLRARHGNGTPLSAVPIPATPAFNRRVRAYHADLAA